MRPLADMTEEERAESRGQWCEDIYGDLYIYLGAPTGSTTYDEETGALMGTFIDPQEPDIIDAPLAAFASRFDFPRAWGADGTPPHGKWEEAEHISKGVTTVYLCGKENPTHRRWIGDWEEA